MGRKRLFWRILPSFLAILCVALLLVLAYTRQIVRDFHHQQVRTDLEERARLLGASVLWDIHSGHEAQVDALCKELARHAQTRVTVMRPDGAVWGDSHKDPSVMDNHADRPEMRTALGGVTGVSTRFSHTLQQNMMYVAVPMMTGADVSVVIRASSPLTDVRAPLGPMLTRLLVAGIVVAAASAFASWMLSRRIAQALQQVSRVAVDFARGDFDVRVPAGDTEEVGQLADALNQMAARLQDQLGTIRNQREEENAVLASMLEGVILVGPDERIVNMNEAAARLLEVDQHAVNDTLIQEAIRNVDLQTFVKRLLESTEAIEGDIVIHEQEMKFLQAHGTLMRAAEGDVSAGLIVLNDVTRLRRLENVRRDFVANVSHELKTPITTIKGFVETLLDGAVDEPENSRKFLGIVARHADRLTAIIEDLLSLSRLEQEKERGGIELQDGSVADVVAAAVEACGPAAERKNVRLDIDCDEGMMARLNSLLLQQAVTNLIDNALKYTEPGRKVAVQARPENGGLCICVTDEGCGISEEHLPRLFERFYRVDKSRSRELGGTGLGLAIVKHVAQVHQGSVSVSSEVDKGSRFCIHLPGPSAKGGVGS